jgi:phytoene/squalene synthetase
MGGLYRELLEKIERSGFRVKEGRVRLTPREKLGALFRTWRDYSRI